MRRVAIGLMLLVLAAVPAESATRVEARLTLQSIPVGSTAALVVTVREPEGEVGEPRFELGEGLEMLGSQRSQSFTWINARSSREVVVRVELSARAAGQHRVGPVRIQVGRQNFISDALVLEVTNEPSAPARSMPGGPVALSVQLDPPDPYVGQPCVLRVRMVQRVALADDSDYQPPSTTGFWSERWGEPTLREGREGGRTVLLTETTQRLYPLAAGTVTVGEARVRVIPATSSGFDPYSGRGASGRPVEVHSDSFRVRVRALPAGAPAGFTQAVGRLEADFSLDRDHSTRDQAITATLTVRGVGNQPLLATPGFAPEGFDVFGSTVEDSLPPAGRLGSAVRRFHWTLVPRREGTLSVPAPAFAWFDPVAGAYRELGSASRSLTVLPARLPTEGSAGSENWPAAFTRSPAQPGGREAFPPLALAAGIGLGMAWRSLRRSTRDGDPLAVERARQREWLRVVGLARGDDFWRAADEAAAWAESRGSRVLRLREEIQAARFGRSSVDEEGLRRRLVERVAEALPPVRPGVPRALTVALWCAVALAAWWGAAPRSGDPARVARAGAGDLQARAGDWAQADRIWRELWSERPGDPALAARLAWGASMRQRPDEAAVWVLRGREREGRDAALSVAEARARESGALTGAPSAPWPVRSLEWAALACALALGAALEWSRRRAALVLAVLAGLCALAPQLPRVLQPLRQWRVVSQPQMLGDTGVELQPGEVVRWVEQHEGRTRVRAGRDLVGWVPDSTLIAPAEEGR